VKAFQDLKQEGIIQHLPTFVGIQAQGYSPIAQAYNSGKSKVKRIENTQTIAQAISNPDPPGGNIVLKLIQENKGIIMAVSDEEIMEAQKILAEYEGIFCQPASATSLAGLLKLSRESKLHLKGQVVLVITGSGLKAVKALASSRIKVHGATLSNLESTLNTLL
jgi:threonine synthase